MSTEWIVPGAKVVVHSHGTAARPAWARADHVARVATKSFTLDSTEGRFSLDRRVRMGGGSWDPAVHVAPFDSDEGRRAIADEERRQRQRKAVGAVDAWRKSQSRADRMAAVAALQAIIERRVKDTP